MKRVGIEWGRVTVAGKAYRRLALYADPRIDWADSKLVKAAAALVFTAFALFMMILTDIN
jgi:hypothetical protein